MSGPVSMKLLGEARRPEGNEYLWQHLRLIWVLIIETKIFRKWCNISEQISMLGK